MAMINCPECGKEISDKAASCPNCGYVLNEGNKTSGSPTININTSSSASASASTPVHVVGFGKPKDKWVAFFLCLFLGPFGAHKFYEGNIGKSGNPVIHLVPTFS